MRFISRFKTAALLLILALGSTASANVCRKGDDQYVKVSSAGPNGESLSFELCYADPAKGSCKPLGDKPSYLLSDLEASRQEHMRSWIGKTMIPFMAGTALSVASFVALRKAPAP